jgi:formylglycine-generating enzyme
MVRIEAGPYEIGASDGNVTPINGLPAERVALSAYEIDAAEVTVRDYAACVAANGCDQPGLSSEASCNWKKSGRENHPINCVTFSQAEAYCAWEKRRLPTEREWEVAARGGGVLRGLDYGEQFRERLCLGLEAGEYAPADAARGAQELKTCPVDREPKPPSKNNVLDMMGNVSEWTTGRFCALAAPHCADRVLRGAAWGSDLYDTYQNRWREPGRGGVAEGRRSPAQVGFRCARSAAR